MRNIMARNKNRKKTAFSNPGSKKAITGPDKKPGSEQSPARAKSSDAPSSRQEIKASSKKAQGEAAQSDKGTENINISRTARHGEDPSQKRTKNLVRLSTCMSGMFLTFVLGLYLGSLVPGIMRGMEEEKQLASQSLETAPASTLAQAAAPAGQELAGQEEKLVSEQKLAHPEKSSIRNSIPIEILEHIKHLEKDALSHPDDPRIWTELGNAYFDIHEPHNAISAYEHSLTLDHSNPDVLTDLGIMYREIKNYDKALDCFRKAYQQDPGHINAIFNEGVVLSADLGRKADAARVWTRILEIDPAAKTPDGQKIADMVRQLQ